MSRFHVGKQINGDNQTLVQSCVSAVFMRQGQNKSATNIEIVYYVYMRRTQLMLLIFLADVYFCVRNSSGPRYFNCVYIHPASTSSQPGHSGFGKSETSPVFVNIVF